MDSVIVSAITKPTCGKSYSRSLLISCRAFSRGSWASGRELLLVFSSCMVLVMLFPPSTWHTTARLPNLRRRHQWQPSTHCRKLAGLLLALEFCFWMRVSFWSWSKCVPFIEIKTSACFSELVTFWTCCIKHKELFWGWPRKHMDLFLWLTKVLPLLPDLELWVCSLPVSSCCVCWLSKHLAISW